MKKLIRYLGFSLSLFSGIASAEVVQVEYIDQAGTPSAKYTAPYYVNPQSGVTASITAGVGRKILLEIKNAKGDLVFTKTKNRVENTDTFIVKDVTYFGAKIDIPDIDDGQYTLTSVIYNGEQQVTRQDRQLVIDTKTPAILGDFYWLHFGSYAYKHSDNKFILSPILGSDAGFPSIEPGASGFSHGTFSSEYIDGPKAGSFHAKDIPLLLTEQGKIIIGTGTQGSINFTHLPDNTANQMRLTYTIFNKVGASTSRTVDVYVATRKSPKPTPYGVYTGAPSQLDGKAIFTGFVPYVAGMTITSNPVRMIYRAPKQFFLGGGGDAEIYGAWLNGSRKPNKVVLTDDQYIYFDLTGSSDGKQFGSMQHYTRDVSTWRTHFFSHDFVVPTDMAPPKSTGFSFYIQGLNQWRNSNVTQGITKFDTSGATDAITKIKLQVEPRLYDQRFSFDYSQFGKTYKGNCIIPSGSAECIIDTNLPYPGNDVAHYHNRHMVTNLTNTLFSQEIVSTWQFDGSIAEFDPATVVNDSVNKKITFTVIDKFKDRINAASTVRVMDAFAVNSKGVKTKLTRTSYISSPLSTSNQQFTATYQYSGLPDGTYTIEGYVEDGFSSTSLRNKNSYVLLTDLKNDTTAPSITTNIKAEAIKSLQSIAINALDASEVTITSVILTGGKDNINMSLPTVKIGNNTFRPEHIYIVPSDTDMYTMTIKAIDAFGNEASHVTKFLYAPVVIKLPDIKQPAISSSLKSEDGLPSNVIQTPQIVNPLGELAQGNHEVLFTVLPTASSGMIINGELISPGETKQFTVNLSQTNHRLTFEAYPAVSGEILTNQFEINLPDVRVTLCPATFELNAEQCISISFLPPDLKCNDPYTLNGASCEAKISYDPSTQCLDAYTLNGTTCKGIYTAAPIQKCPNGYSNVDSNTCEKVQTKALKVCPDDQSVIDSFCKSKEGLVTPQKAYCEGIDVSGGSVCEGGKCYTNKPEWNACQITEQLPTIPSCQVGSFVAGSCQVSDEYELNMQCPFGFNRDGIICKRIEIVDPIKTCEDGFTLAGSTCSKTEVAPYSACPVTHYFLEGRCHAISPTTINCPVNYSWNGTICEDEQQKPAVPVCPEEHFFNGTVCQKDEFVKANAECPEGYAWDGNICSTTLTNIATPVCDLGYEWDGSDCFKDESQPGTLQCSEGYIWDGTQCTTVDSIEANLVCPDTYTWNSTTSICERLSTQPAEAQCELGFELNVNGQCDKIETETPIEKCADGFTLSDSICTKTDEQSATKQCPPTYVLTTDGTQCEKIQTTSSTNECPLGYSWDGTTCKSSYQTGINPTGWKCPYGDTWTSPPTGPNQLVCLAKAELQCPSGYALNEEDPATCYNYPESKKKISGVCPASHPYPYIDNNFNCATSPDKRYAIPAIDPSTSCQSGFNKDSIWGCKAQTPTSTIGYHCCEGGLTYNPTTLKMDGFLTSPKVQTCPADFSYQGGICRKTVYAPYSFQCPASWTLSGNKCTQTTTEEPTDTCNIDWTLDGAICTKFTTQAPNLYSCPSDWILDGTICNFVTKTTQVYSCSIDRTLVDSKCEKTLTKARDWTCPNGWSGDSTCSRTLKIPPISYDCPIDWTVNGSNCDQIVKQPPNKYLCELGWVNEADQCRLTTTEPILSYQCDLDWTLDQTICRIVLTEPETRTCSATHTKIDELRCHLNTPATNVGICEEGWTSNLTHCIMGVAKPADLSCLPTYDLIADQCHTTITQPVTVECQPEEVFENGKCVMTRTHTPVPLCPSPYLLENPTSCKNEIVIPKYK